RERREIERGRDPEVAAAPAPACPEQVVVVRGVGRDEATVGRHEFHASQRVARETVPARHHADATPGREAGDADRRTRAARDRNAPSIEVRVQVDETGTGSDRGSVADDGDRAHRGYVDDEPGGGRIAAIA